MNDIVKHEIGNKDYITIRSKTHVRCCGDDEYYVYRTNGGYTTVCKCGHNCGEWFSDVFKAIRYFEDNCCTKKRERNN